MRSTLAPQYRSLLGMASAGIPLTAAAPQWAFYEPYPSPCWVLMGPTESSQLEAAYADPGRTQLELSCGERRFQVDLTRMEQTSVQTGFRRAISRQCGASHAAVWEWQENDGSWKAYDPCAAGQLSAAQAANRQTTIIFVLSHRNANPYCVEWSGGADGGGVGTQRNVKTGVVRPIRWRTAAASGHAAAAASAAASSAPASFAAASADAAASGCPSLATLHFQAVQQLDTPELARLTGWSELRPGEWEEGADDPIMFSPLGEDGEAVVRLPCHSAAISCTFNLSTIEQALRARPQCPTCKQVRVRVSLTLTLSLTLSLTPKPNP